MKPKTYIELQNNGNYQWFVLGCSWIPPFTSSKRRLYLSADGKTKTNPTSMTGNEILLACLSARPIDEYYNDKPDPVC
jgi:hypothetical protein